MFKIKVFYFISLIVFIVACSKDTKETISPAELQFNTFGYSQSENPQLAQSILCTITSDSIIAVTFAGTDISSLKASFSSSAEKVQVDNKIQTSGISKQDFTKHIKYTLTFKNGSTKNYVVKFVDTEIPALHINTNNQPIESRSQYVAGNLKAFESRKSIAVFEGEIEIKGRGNSTWDFPKKPYKIKLNEKAKFLGMNSSKKWVLLANYADKSLLRNEVGFELSKRLGMAYTPESILVDVILNGEYMGNYELVEQIDVAKDKINVVKQNLDDPNISGGYLVEMDGFAESENVNFRTPRNMKVSVKYPDDEEITKEQVDYIKNHISNFEEKLFSINEASEYQNYFDIKSYINFYLINEIIGNPDIFWSTYMYKQKDDNLLYTSPVWDFDIAANNDSRLGDAQKKLMLDAAHEPKQWINQLMKDPTFRAEVRKRWNEVKDIIKVENFITAKAASIGSSQKKNFLKWPILDQKIYLNIQAAGSFESEVSFLKNYFNERIKWLDSQFNSERFD